MAVFTLKQLVRKQGLRRRRTPKPVRMSRANELWYKARLLGIANRLQALAEQYLLPILRREASSVNDTPLEDEINAAIAKMAAQFGGLDALAKRLATEALTRNLHSVDDGLVRTVKNSLGIDISAVLNKDARLAAAMAKANTANVELITSIPGQYLDRVKDLVDKGFSSGTRFEGMIAEIQNLGSVTESRATLIARDQTSKMNGAFNEARQQSLGINRYRWMGAGDERERETHVANNGKIFSWDDPPEETGHPGEDYQCRCSAIPVFDFEEF